MKILVFHRIGCDTGCCGHSVGWFPDDFTPEDKWDYFLNTKEDKFDFTHPYTRDHFEFAKRLVAHELGEEHVKDLDFENSFITDDCDGYY